MRLNLPYFMCDDAVEFVLQAVKMVAQYGWKLLPQVKKSTLRDALTQIVFDGTIGNSAVFPPQLSSATTP